MDPSDVEALIEDAIPDSEATVEPVRDAPGHDHLHLAATVVSPAFEGEPLVQQHDAVYDALGERMTNEIHGIELSTYTPAEYERREE